MKLESIASTVTATSVVVASKEQIGCDLGGEEVILDLDSGIYYGLNEVGASIWKLIQEAKSVTEIKKAIMEEYDVQPDRCETSILRLLNELAERNLISVSDQTD
jgi:hypothetical protein